MGMPSSSRQSAAAVVQQQQQGRGRAWRLLLLALCCLPPPSPLGALASHGGSDPRDNISRECLEAFIGSYADRFKDCSACFRASNEAEAEGAASVEALRGCCSLRKMDCGHLFSDLDLVLQHCTEVRARRRACVRVRAGVRAHPLAPLALKNRIRCRTRCGRASTPERTRVHCLARKREPKTRPTPTSNSTLLLRNNRRTRST